MTKIYQCAACGEGVKGYEVDLGGVTEVRCLSCGLPLEKRGEGGRPKFRRVLVADDSGFFTQGLETFLLSRRLASEVLKAEDGARALELAVTALRDKQPVGLAVLDILMPRLNGLHAAVALRAVEKAFGSAKAPVLFLSSRRIDEGFQQSLQELKPAYYVNKGTGGEEGLLGHRLETILQAIPTATSARPAGKAG